MPAPRHNAPLRRRALLPTHASGKLTSHHLSTPYRLRENTRSREYLRFTAVVGNSLISRVFMKGVVGVRANLSRTLHYSITRNSV